jgi:hypothetical protein
MAMSRGGVCEHYGKDPAERPSAALRTASRRIAIEQRFDTKNSRAKSKAEPFTHRRVRHPREFQSRMGSVRCRADGFATRRRWNAFRMGNDAHPKSKLSDEGTEDFRRGRADGLTWPENGLGEERSTNRKISALASRAVGFDPGACLHASPSPFALPATHLRRALHMR